MPDKRVSQPVSLSGRLFRLMMVVGISLLVVVGFGLLAFGTAPSSVKASDLSANEIVELAMQGTPLGTCGDVSQYRDLQTAVPTTPQPTPENAPTATPRPATPTPRPAPSEDRVGFPENYEKDYQLLFVFDRPDNRQVRVICGNEIAAARQPDEPFAYGSVLVMITYRAKLGADGQPMLDADGHYIREAVTGIFVQRKEPGFGEAYLEDRSGEWEYVAYRPNGDTLIPPGNTNNCARCHLTQAGENVDFTFRMDYYHEGEAALAVPTSAPDQVSIFIYAFMPNTLTVRAGTTITWINDDEAEHTVVADDTSFESEVLKTINIKPGDSFSFTFDQPGTYTYVCSIHPAMKGVIEVT